MKIFAPLLMIFFSLTVSAEPNCTGAYDTTFAYDFKTACFKHDSCYRDAVIQGLTKEDCDKRFLTAMKAECKPGSILYSFCKGAAQTYYFAVSTRKQSRDRFQELMARAESYRTKMIRLNDVKAIEAFNLRFDQQNDWYEQAKYCSSLTNSVAYKACRDELKSRQVIDSPEKYPFGACNYLGMNWARGHRELNAKIISNRLGIPITYEDLRFGNLCADL